MSASGHETAVGTVAATVALHVAVSATLLPSGMPSKAAVVKAQVKLMQPILRVPASMPASKHQSVTQGGAEASTAEAAASDTSAAEMPSGMPSTTVAAQTHQEKERSRKRAQRQQKRQQLAGQRRQQKELGLLPEGGEAVESKCCDELQARVQELEIALERLKAHARAEVQGVAMVSDLWRERAQALKESLSVYADNDRELRTWAHEVRACPHLSGQGACWQCLQNDSVLRAPQERIEAILCERMPRLGLLPKGA